MGESCDAVERELDKVLVKFGGVSEHFDRTIDKQIDFINALREQFEEGIQKSITFHHCSWSCSNSFFVFTVSEEYELTQNQATILSDAVTQVRETVGRVATDHRDLHSSVSKVGKAIDRVGIYY